MSILVSQPRILTTTDCTAVIVNMGVAVPVAGIGVLVAVGGGISVLVGVTGSTTVTPGTAVSVKGSVRMIGVAVTMLGVREGITVQTGKGWGDTVKVSHAPRKNMRTNKADDLLMIRLYPLRF
jgi:hypothetical protein